MPLPMPTSPVGASAQVDSPNTGSDGAQAPQPLVSPSPAGPTGPVGPTPEMQSEAFIGEVRDLSMRISSLARNFPAAAEDFQMAGQSLINGMTKAIISQSNTETQSAPNLVQ